MASVHLPQGFTGRVGDPVPVEDLVGLISAVSVAAIGRIEWTADLVRALTNMPTVDRDADLLFVFDPTDRLVAATLVDHPPPYVTAILRGYVDPGFLDRGLGTAMLDWARRRVAERIPLAPAGARITVTAAVADGYRPATALLENAGFQVERFFLEMALRFDKPPGAATFPGGVRLRSFAGEPDLVVLSETVAEAFEDHFGHIARTPQEELERWQTFRATDAWDDSLIWFAIEGDEVAGAVVGLGQSGDDPDAGYIATLGVRRPWRGRGIARALLLTAFRELDMRGRSRVTLHVDADNLTGATRLYESVGMTARSRSVVYLDELRAGDDHVVR
jgi:mycothiol synthase